MLRWDCEKCGCFNKKMRLKFHVFNECFKEIGHRSNPNFTDIDGAVSINGRMLFLEWKSNNKPLGIGQQILFQGMLSMNRKLKHGRIIILVVYGNAETMTVDKFYQYKETWRVEPDWITSETLFEFVERWANWANASTPY